MTTVAQLLKYKGNVIHSVEPEAPVLEAIELMAQHGVGVVSERDYARKVILLGRSSSETPVWQIMSSPVLSVRPEQSVRECMQLMTEHRVRHLPAIADQRVIGVLSIGDLVRAVLEEQQQTIEQLEQYIHS